MDKIIVPLTLKEANDFVTKHHRHNKKVVGHKFSIGVKINNKLVAVAIVGRPVARKLDNGLTMEITRLCVINPAPKNICSFLYSRCCRIWKAMGGEKIITYTLETENGASLKASNFIHKSTTNYSDNSKGWLTRDKRISQKIDKINKLRWEYNLI
tara:strand:- start:57 stop:521 length:465 start_codon:yes stop_codon:yes gene_type:complete